MGRWPQHKAWFWEYAPFFRVLLPFVAGIVIYNHGRLHFTTPVSGIAITCIFACLYLLLTFLQNRFKVPALASFLLLQLMFLACGYSLSSVYDVNNDTAWFGNHIDKAATYIARLTDAPAEKEQSWKLQVEIISSIKDNKVGSVEGKAFVYVYKDKLPMLLQKGDSILLLANWQIIKNTGNPYEFDYATYCRRNNIYYQQFCSSKEVRLYAAAEPMQFSVTERVHDWCMAQLDEYITDPKTRGLIQAMLLGDEINLDEGLRQSFTDTGIVHVIAISGGNIIIFFSVIATLLWWVRHRRYLWVKYLIALPLVWFYVIMAGASPSAIRAAIMFSVLAWGIMFQKNNTALNQLFATAFLLLCAEPMWLYAIGFQLSFIAVLSLVLFYVPIYALWVPKNKWVKKVWAAICASFAAEILVAPVVVYYFHSFPLFFLVANIAAFIFMEWVLILGIAIIVLAWFPLAAKGLAILITCLVKVFDVIIKWMQGCNPASFHFLKLTMPQLLLWYVAVAGIAYALMRKKKIALFAGIGAFCGFLVLLCIDKWATLHQQRFVVYNVANGNHIEYIVGDKYHVVGADTLAPKKIAYAVTPSHTMWQAWQEGGTINNDLFRLHNSSILVLNHEMDTTIKFPVDYLVVNYTAAINPAQLTHIFSPKLIIIGNNYSRKEQEEWVEKTALSHIAIHALARDGAFVLEK